MVGFALADDVGAVADTVHSSGALAARSERSSWDGVMPLDDVQLEDRVRQVLSEVPVHLMAVLQQIQHEGVAALSL